MKMIGRKLALLLLLLLLPWLLGTVNQNRPALSKGAIELDDPTGSGNPLCAQVLLDEELLKTALKGTIHLVEQGGDRSPIAVQYEQQDDSEAGGFLCWQMPAGKKGRSVWFDPEQGRIVDDNQAVRLSRPVYRDRWKFPAHYL